MCWYTVQCVLCDGARSAITLLSDPGLELIVITQGSTFSMQTFIATEKSLQVRLLFGFIFTSLDKTNLKFFETIAITYKKAYDTSNRN